MPTEDGKLDGKPKKKNRSAERQRNRELNAQKAKQAQKLNAQKAKQAQKQLEKRAAAKAAFIARTDFPPSPSPSTYDVAPPLGPEQFDYDDSGGEYRIAVELGLTTLWC